MRRSLRLAIVLGGVAGHTAVPAAAQTPDGPLVPLVPLVPLTRQAAVEAALTRGGRLAVARADSAAAAAALRVAREVPNPSLSLSYSRSEPIYHVIADVPVDVPWLRGPRVRVAELGQVAARWRFAAERAAVALEADTTYTRALAARARADLSRRTALDADSLRRLAALRRDAGDASDLDVELATVNAGQQANVAATDSMSVIDALLDLQTVIGLAEGRVAIAPSDSLAPPAEVLGPPGPAATDAIAPAAGGALATPGSTGPSPLAVAAAEAALSASQTSALLQRRSRYGAPSLTAGVETGDAGSYKALPTVGVAVPLPLFNRNRGAIAQAEAEQARAGAELALARVSTRTEIARAVRARDMALARVARDQALVTSANRVATLAITAYREGASTLPNVLEAQRNARDVLAQYVDDVASALIASATLRVLTLTTDSSTPR